MDFEILETLKQLDTLNPPLDRKFISDGRFKSLKHSIYFNLKKHNKNCLNFKALPREWIYPFFGNLNFKRITAIAAFAVVNKIPDKELHIIIETINDVLNYQKCNWQLLKISKKISHIYKRICDYDRHLKMWKQGIHLCNEPLPPNYFSFNLKKNQPTNVLNQLTTNKGLLLKEA